MASVAAYASYASAGEMTTMFGRARMIAMSSSAWWDAPSAPTLIPQWVDTTLTLSLGYARASLICSQHLPLANTANVDANTVLPDAARPAAMPMRFCSAIPTSTNLSGATFLNSEVLVDPARSASMAMTLGLVSANLARAFP